MFIDCKNEIEWLEARKNYLTASDAANYCGLNPFDPSGKLHLWEEKTGLAQRPDIGNKPAVRFGKEAEDHIRALFALRHPEYELKYDQYGLYVSDDYPYLASTLDCLLIERATRAEDILEVKTTTVHSRKALDEWFEGGPINYYCQNQHQSVCVPKARGIWLVSLVQVEWDPSCSYYLEHYINANDPEFQSDRRNLLENAADFWNLVQTRKRPSQAFVL